ncbi:bifunctional diguanylate cyclase/phosphodiesterase [Roseomonas aeriglobus]|nr:bifunctional diguanylate cyclase/phosphodiesterase [Roseomonas aeriglobus]
MLFRKARAPSLSDAVPAPDAGASTCAQGPAWPPDCIDLSPVPVAIVSFRGGAVTFDAVNRRFRQAGLGAVAAESPVVQLLGGRIAAFLESDALEQEFSWQFGEAIDARYFRVMLARRATARGTGRCLISLVDQTPEQRTETSLRREMQSDSLTGLPNRAGFEDLIDSHVTTANARSHAVMIVNLARFSRVNACMGSLAGDELLISVARRIKGALRGRDMLARIGGDEFAVLIETDDAMSDAMNVARRFHAALSTPFRLSDFEIRVDCSIGIALGVDEIVAPEDLIRHAQFAVKRAKQTGQVEVYSRTSYDVVRTQFGIETRLRRAIENGEMTLAFQPICDLSTGRIVSFESLARWSPDGVAISPSEFIPVAEESGLILPLGRWAADAAAQAIADWDHRAGRHCGVNVAVNVSAIQLQRDDVPMMVRRALDTHGVDGNRFTLELTESAIIGDHDRISDTLKALKELDTRLAMDDFGTGYSNLAYLQRLPIDVLKIDRSFISGMLADRDKVAIVRAILSLAQALGMKTTAEGVESNELAQTLAALGCTYGQGFLYSRPVDSDEAFRLLAADKA